MTMSKSGNKNFVIFSTIIGSFFFLAGIVIVFLFLVFYFSIQEIILGFLSIVMGILVLSSAYKLKIEKLVESENDFSEAIQSKKVFFIFKTKKKDIDLRFGIIWCLFSFICLFFGLLSLFFGYPFYFVLIYLLLFIVSLILGIFDINKWRNKKIVTPVDTYKEVD